MMSNRGEGALNWVCGADVLPVFGGEIINGQEKILASAKVRLTQNAIWTCRAFVPPQVLV